MDSYLSQWFIDASSVCSVVGLVLTYAVWLKTKKIKQDLISRTRLPKVSRDLSLQVSAYIESVELWRSGASSNANNVALKLGTIKGMLHNAKYHVSSDELRAVDKLLTQLSRKRFLLFVIPWSKLTLDEAEGISVELNHLASVLQQRVYDLRVPV
ncbi:hypothetical protein [Pseudomonas lini]|uniref:hypothetical protein n=1 Tax=Pseudomonas lini TaxID=163011 RepID=UPI0012E15ED0|nr:hypothetical protein [Pseudomonas lini]